MAGNLRLPRKDDPSASATRHKLDLTLCKLGDLDGARQQVTAALEDYAQSIEPDPQVIERARADLERILRAIDERDIDNFATLTGLGPGGISPI